MAWAEVTDNMFPTLHTSSFCVKGMHSTPCQTDNRDVSYYMDSSGEFMLETPDRTDVQNVMAGEYAPTDLVIAYDSTPTFSGGAETDIVYQEGSAGISDSADGMTWCDGLGGDIVDCDQQVVRIRGNGYYTYSLVCHETGHAVGLEHGNIASPQMSKTASALGCMKTPTGGTTTLGANNRDNINLTY
ncbi:hypothetical protein ITP53_22955 [Nonomuraea sp. K274]|uniref:Matrixin n=1 Tax=Nonomuraea cypriaca TaxID=1187855 RepID=A0A931A8W0_9ACTN|nr:hypothetical protein [Nonomuraea cypriaca]